MFQKHILSLSAVSLFLLVLQGSAQADYAALQDWLYDNYRTDLISFLEVRNGWRLDRDQDEKDATLAEARWQVDFNSDLGWGYFKLKTDFVGDMVEEEALAELREVNVSFSPHRIVDAKIGRQIITWGTGDLVFINDLFPKDWVAFFIGRDVEYLKSPSDAAKFSIFFDAVNVDLVYSPLFSGSNYIDGSRLSYWNGLNGRIGDRQLIANDHERNRFFDDSEFAARLYKNVKGTEYALYAYSGYWQTPEGVDPQTFNLIYPRLSVYGLSVRGTLLGGVANMEAGYYDSRQDRHGTDPFVRNDEIRFLLGFEHELGSDFTGAFQYYQEWKQDYSDYEQTLPINMKKADEYRHLLTLRLTKLMLNQTLIASLFTYYSPSDNDWYLRPNLTYKVSDHLTIEGGANIFAGANDHTFFAQFMDNSNAYAGLRWNF